MNENMLKTARIFLAKHAKVAKKVKTSEIKASPAFLGVLGFARDAVRFCLSLRLVPAREFQATVNSNEAWVDTKVD